VLERKLRKTIRYEHHAPLRDILLYW
jgi:hypothetical protein